MNPDTVRRALQRPDFWKDLRVYDTLPSSIDTLKALAERGAKQGSAVVALAQTEARGRAGRVWQAPRGGVWLSALFRPAFSAERAGCVSVLVAVVLAEYFEAAFDLPVQVKWPNDLWLDGKKLSGILIDLSTQGNRIEHLIASVGTNVNNDLPQDTAIPATSLAQALGCPQPLERVAAVVLDALAHGYQTFLEKGFTPFIERFEARSALGEIVSFEREGSWVTAGVIGLCDDGKLAVQTLWGQQRLAAEDVHLAAS